MINAKPTHVVLATPAPVSHRTAEESLGLGYLASYLRNHGYQVSIIDAWLEGLSPDQLAARIISCSPTLCVGFSAYQSNMPVAEQTLKCLRANGFSKPIIAGGYGPTFHPMEFLQAGFNYVVRGEGEEPLLAICNSLREGTSPHKTHGLAYMRDGKMVLNSVVPLSHLMDEGCFPARDTIGLTIKRKNPVHILTSRGCAANCLFCSVTSFQREIGGQKWRPRGTKDFVDEVASLYKTGVNSFKVIDDSLIEPPRDGQWCKALADELEKRDLRATFRSSIRADRVTDEVLFHLKRAGFVAFSCGIENFSPQALKRMNKSATLEDNVRALNLFKKHDIYVQAGQILFDPKTTMEDLWINYRYMREFDWMISKGIFTEMYAAAGTPFTKLLRKSGAIDAQAHRFGNYQYQIENPMVQKVHYCLKAWHKAHMGLYDKAIDPLSAPKALGAEAFPAFHAIYMKIRALDLQFMGQTLDFAATDPTQSKIDGFIDHALQNVQPAFADIAAHTDQAYAAYGLSYDAAINPFI